jgi:hypothetical protein
VPTRPQGRDHVAADETIGTGDEYPHRFSVSSFQIDPDNPDSPGLAGLPLEVRRRRLPMCLKSIRLRRST